MAKIVKNNIDYTSTPSSASMLPYDNFGSGLDATNVQEAIDEIAETGGGAKELSDLTDVEISGQTVGQVLKYNGYKWANADESGGDLSNYYTKSETNTLLDDKADVSDLPDMTDYYDKSETDTLLAGKADTSDVPQNLQDLDNVTISSATNGQVLQYNSGTWVNADAGSANIWEGTQAQYDAIPVKDNDTVYYITDGATVACTAEEVVYDNTTSGLSATDVQSAIDEIVSGGVTQTLTGLDDVNINSSTLSNGQVLTYDSTNTEWINRTIWTDLTATLVTGATSLTIQDNSITTNSTIEVFADNDIDYNSITVTTGQIVLTFDAQVGNIGIKVRVS